MADRPDPDELLALAKAEEEREHRGKLKIFFGATAGVGKTYAMLEGARELARRGVDVVVGVVETHGRKETEALLEGLEILPRRAAEHRGAQLQEFDLDGARARRPAVVLVDELAHTNAPGSRHAKRWQDVEELLAEGIDVWTTVNVQHLESLNDLVGKVTGVVVRETVPDSILERADQVELVDLPPEELLKRLAEGLGAENVTLSGQRPAEEILKYARRRNVSKIVVGKPLHARWKDVLFGSVRDELVRASGGIDVYVISGEEGGGWPVAQPRRTPERDVRGYVAALLVTAGMTGLCVALRPWFEPTNLAMLMLLGVVGIASRFGRGPAILTSVLAVA